MRYKSFGLVVCGLLCVGSLALGSYFSEKYRIDLDSVSDASYEVGEDYLESIKEKSGADSVRVVEEDVHGYRKLELEKGGKPSFIEINVVDTVKPEFVEQSELVELSVGSSDEDLLAKFKATDSSEMLEYYVDGHVDYNIVGEYKVKIACCDAFANTSTVDVTVVIK